MNDIKRIYENIKAHNENLDERIHVLLNSFELERLQAVTEGRYSLLFIIKLILVFLNGDGVNRIIHEIRALEGAGTKKSKMKPQTKFKRGSIKGLWHKHYLPSGINSFVKNIDSQIKIKESELNEEINLILGSGNLSIIEKSNKIAKMVVNQFDSRSIDNRLTGEWIIYHIHNGKNYYLDISKHTDKESEIVKNIKIFALAEFPEFIESLPIFSKKSD